MVGLANDADPVVRQRVAVVARHLAPDATADILQRYTSDQVPTLCPLTTAELTRLTNTATS